jgi:hypothetical protein
VSFKAHFLLSGGHFVTTGSAFSLTAYSWALAYVSGHDND